jgi:hypothetical protein
MNPTKADSLLILGLALGYDRYDLSPFVYSLVRSRFRGKCVLFGQFSRSTESWLRDNNVTPFTVNQHFPYIDGQSNHSLSDAASMLNKSHCIISRYAVYLIYLEALKEKPEKVLLTDVRDVIFQDDPFAFSWPPSSEVVFVLENGAVTIGQEEFNRRWVLDCLGERIYSELSNKVVSCAGTTYGTGHGMILYLRCLLSVIVEKQLLNIGADQAIHNYILYHQLVSGIATLDNESGPVFTMHSVATDQFSFKFSSGVVRRNRSLPSVVHQYDRNASLNRKIRIKYTYLEEGLRGLLQAFCRRLIRSMRGRLRKCYAAL